jgi:large subunit ribosomal protein L1
LLSVITIGKASFDEKALYANLAALMEAIKKARPAASKGNFIRRVTLTTTMGPGIRIDPNLIQSMEVSD